MRRTVLTLTALVLIAAPLYSQQGASEPVTVPFEMLQKGKLFSGHIAVQVKVNGKGPYRLIFDTGAPTNLLSNRVAKEAGLLGGGRRSSAAAILAMPGQVTVGKLEVGDLAAEDLGAVVLDHPTVKAIAEVFGPIDGIVGFPFFARYRTAIDYQAKTLTFTANGFKPTDTVQALMATMTARREDRQKPRLLVPAALWGLRVEKGADDEEPGVLVADVFPESPAAKAGLKVGDRLLTLDGRWTDSVADCYLAAEAVKPGQSADVTMRRTDQELKLSITPINGQ